MNLPRKQFPNGLARWFNIYDVRDPVACAGGFSELVGSLEVGKTFLYRTEQRAFDISIRNDACPASIKHVNIEAHEDFTGYGQCAQLAQVVSDFWQRFDGLWA